MQFKHFLPFLAISFLFFAFQTTVDAQRIAQNRNGERIIIFPDGNWEKYDSKNPQHKAIKKNYDKQLEEKELPAKKVITEKGLSETKGEKVLRMARERVSYAEDDLVLATERLNEAKFKRMELEDELIDLEENEAKAHEISFVENKIKGAKSIESQAKKHLRMAKKGLKAAKKELIANAPKDQKKKSKNTKKVKYAKRKSPVLTPDQAKEKQLQKQSTLTAETKQFAKYDINKDVMYNPPKSDCGFLFEGVDEFLGKRRKDVNIGTFFTYTDDEMRRYLGNKEYLICEGNLTQIEGGILLLNLHYSIATRDASRTFGGLSQGSLLTVKFINGSKIKLVNTKDVTGQYDPLTERHTFVAQYIINSGQEKALKKEEVDKVRVIWKTGFEDYEIHDVDFIKNQLSCLKRK